jgi:hypothetical protein
LQLWIASSNFSAEALLVINTVTESYGLFHYDCPHNKFLNKNKENADINYSDVLGMNQA